MGTRVRVFSNKNGRVHAPMIPFYSKDRRRQVGNSEKGTYAFRRTVDFKMRREEVPATAALLGHTEDANEQYHTYNINGIEEKAEIILRINAEMPNLGNR